MASAQTRIAETVALFYTADRTSDVRALLSRMCNDTDRQGAMAGHAYKSAVDELDAGVGRDLVSSFRAQLVKANDRMHLSELPSLNLLEG